MSAYSKKLHSDKIIKNIEPYILENVQYETIMGSQAYGVSSESSDLDIYGFTIPPKRIVFPHTAGHIYGFRKAPESFKQFQQHHINAYDKEIDITIYNIVTYFSLLCDNNPNILDSLFSRTQSVTHCTNIGTMVKDNRRIFLHKGAWYKFRGYAYSQLNKIKNRNPHGKRREIVDKFGYDVKHAYHIVRLICEVEDILMYGDFDLMEHKEILKSVRRGEWTLERIESYFNEKEKNLDSLFVTSTLPKYPDEDKIKQLLLDCLEEFYGKIDASDVQTSNQLEQAMLEIKKIVNKVVK